MQTCIDLKSLYRHADPRQTAREMEAADLEPSACCCQRFDRDPARDQAEPVLPGFANFAAAATRAGADDPVLFNRFYQPHLDLDALEVVPARAEPALGDPRLPVRWIAILRPHPAAGVSLAVTSGPTRAPTSSRASWSAPTS